MHCNFLTSEPFSLLLEVIKGLEGESTEGSFEMEYGMWHTFKLTYYYIIVADESVLEIKFYIDKDLEMWRAGQPQLVLDYFRRELNQMVKDIK